MAIDKWLDRAERIWRLIRPLPHNRLALFTVFFGGALLFTPIWELLIVALSQRLGIELPDPPPFWVGFLLIVAGLSYHLAVTAITLPKVQFASPHDLAVAERFLAGHNVDGLVEDVDFIADNHRYRSIQAERLDHFVRDLSAGVNEFVDPDVRSAALVLAQVLGEYRTFLAYNFFVYPDRQTGDDLRFAMHPGLTWDTGSPTEDGEEMYRRKTAELCELADRTIAGGRAFQRLLNERILSRRPPRVDAA